MDYFKAFEKLKTALEKAKIPLSDGHFAVQAHITDEDCGGIFYIEKRDLRLFVEPYDYYDNNACIFASFDTFKKMFEGKISAKAAFDDGSLIIDGDAEGFFETVEPIFDKKSKRTATAAKTRKTAAKKTSGTTRKCAEKKTTKSAGAKDEKASGKTDTKVTEKTEEKSTKTFGKSDDKPSSAKSKSVKKKKTADLKSEVSNNS